MTPDDEIREKAKKRLQDKREFAQHLVAFVVVNAGLIAIWALTGEGYFWPGWVLFGWGVGLVLHAWTVFVQKPVTEADIQHEIDKMRSRQDQP